MWISVKTSRSLIVDASFADAFALVRDLERVAQLLPGVDRTQTVAPGRYTCYLKPRRSVGRSFVGVYTCEFRDNGVDSVTWHVPQGNVRSEGSWHVDGSDGAVTLTLEMTTAVDLKIPRFLQKIAAQVATLETKQAVTTQLEAIRAVLEGEDTDTKRRAA